MKNPIKIHVFNIYREWKELNSHVHFVHFKLGDQTKWDFYYQPILQELDFGLKSIVEPASYN